MDQIIATENLSDEQKAGAIRVISSLAMVANIAAAIKGGGGDAVASTLFSALVSLLSAVFMEVLEFFESLPSMPNREIG